MSSHALLLDDKQYHLTLLDRSIRNNLYNGIYALSRQDVAALSRANSVGIALRFTDAAGVFLGFQGMPISDGKPKLAGYLNSCH